MREMLGPVGLLVVPGWSRDRREPPDSREKWKSTMSDFSLSLNAELLNHVLGDKPRGSFPELDRQWVKEVKRTGDLAGRTLMRLWRLERQLADIDGEDPAATLLFMRHGRERQECLEGLVEKVKTNKPFNVPATMALDLQGKIREREGGDFGVLVRRMILNDLVAAWLMTGDGKNFLVGTNGGIFQKRLRFGELERIKDAIRSGAPEPPEEEIRDALRDVFNNGPQYLVNLAHVGQRELNLVPERPIAQPGEAGLHFPIPGEGVEKLLKDAYYGQKFLVPLEGAWVQLQDAGDLKKMFVLQKGDIFVARIITTKGDFLAGLNLETAERYDYLGKLGVSRDEEFFANVLKILAEVYHDLVTVEELPPGNGRLMRGTRAIGPGREGAKEPRPRIIYIPRKVRRREGEVQLTRPRYEGPRRPVKPHEVGGFARRARMTEGHKSVLEEFERETGIRVLELVAQINAETGEPHTYVRPHVRGEGLPEAPVFIQRRVREKLAERIGQQSKLGRAKNPSS